MSELENKPEVKPRARKPKPAPQITGEHRIIPKRTDLDKEMPAESDLNKELPDSADLNKEIPKETELNKEMPEESKLDKDLPPVVNPENVIRLGDQDIEIKPTKLLYQRNRTAAAYRILEIYPLPDVLAMEKGILDPERDGDSIVFDFLTAVFDNKPGAADPEWSANRVREYYDSMTSEDIDRAVKIFKRLNHIEDKEEAAKNRAAKGMTH